MSDHGHSHGGGHAAHGHGHGHGTDLEQPLLPHEESGAGAEDQKKLKMAVYFALFFMFVEIFGGILAGSLAIITDAAHMLSDVGGFIVSLVALQLSAKAATAEYTYGFKQAEVLGALLSIAIVWAITAVLLWEAVQRFIEIEEVDAPVMFVISVIGFVVNIVLMQVLGHGHAHGDAGHGHSHGHEHGHGGHDAHGCSHGGDGGGSVAVQAAMAHVIGDIVQSLGVCVAAGCIWWQPYDLGVAPNGVNRWNYADPCCTVLFGILVLFTTKGTLERTIETLMMKAPAHIEQDQLTRKLESIEGVVQVHDLHIWSMGSSDVLATAHIVVASREACESVLRHSVEASKALGLKHTTFQLEVESELLADCGADCGVSPRGRPKKPEKPSGEHGGHGGHVHDAGHGGGCCDGHSHDEGHAHDAGQSHGGHSPGGHAHDTGHGGGCCDGHSHDAGHSHASGHSAHGGGHSH